MTINLSNPLKAPSWRTNSLGLSAILVGLTSAYQLWSAGNRNFTDPQWLAAISSVLSGFGLTQARDDKTTSEQVGLAPQPNPTAVPAPNPPPPTAIAITTVPTPPTPPTP